MPQTYVYVVTRLLFKEGGRGFPLATKNVVPGYFHRKIEPKEIPSSLTPHLLVVFTRQLEILVKALWLCFLIACFSRNNLTDFYDFWHP